MNIFVPLCTSVWIISHALIIIIIIIYNLEAFFALQKSNLDCHLSLNNSMSLGEPVQKYLHSFIYLLDPILKTLALLANLIILILFFPICG